MSWREKYTKFLHGVQCSYSDRADEVSDDLVNEVEADP